MTYEEFKKAVNIEPKLNYQSIFRVETFFIGCWDVNDNGEQVDPYVESTTLDLDVPVVYYCLTFEEAKQQILSAQKMYSDSFHSARVVELPVGLQFHDGEYLSITVFDRNADISFRSRLPTIEWLTDVEGKRADTTFYGYPEKEIPYHEGEIVEAMDSENDTVRLGIVVKTPMSLEDNWKHFLKTGRLVDVIDRYKIMTDEDECEYFATDLIFRPSFPVSDEIRNQLKEWYDGRSDTDSTDFEALLEML